MTVRFLLALAAAALLGLSLTACGPQTVQREPCPAGKLCLEYGNGPDPQSLDPQLATTTNEAAILRELFEGMYTDDDHGAPELGVAARDPDISPDGLVWTFHLRPEKWSDGQPLTANDFVFAYRRMLDPKTASSYAYLLYVIKNAQALNEGKARPDQPLGARAIDDETLQLTLEHPASYLPQLLKHQAFFPIPAHLVERVGDDWKKPGVMVSNGAYTLVSWTLGNYVRIARNPLYHDAAKVCFDRVDFSVTLDAVTAERRALGGELDVSNGIQGNHVRRLQADPGSARFVRSHPYLITTYLALNTRDVKALQDIRVRRAISMAIDRQFLTVVRGDGSTPTASFVPLGIADYLNRDAPHPADYWAGWPLAQRQAEARRLLAEAGYGPDNRLRLGLKTADTGTGSPSVVVQAIQSDLHTVGIDLALTMEDSGVLYQSLNQRDFQVSTAAWVADYDDPMTFLALLQSDTGQQNYGDYHNPEYDRLLAAANQEADAGKRTALLAQAETLAMQDDNLVPLYNGVNLNLVSPHITGWVDNDADIHPIRNLCRDDAGPRPSK